MAFSMYTNQLYITSCIAVVIIMYHYQSFVICDVTVVYVNHIANACTTHWAHSVHISIYTYNVSPIFRSSLKLKFSWGAYCHTTYWEDVWVRRMYMLTSCRMDIFSTGTFYQSNYPTRHAARTLLKDVIDLWLTIPSHAYAGLKSRHFLYVGIQIKYNTLHITMCQTESRATN